ncbi:hypothetical protein POTOM_011408 [Populus tomentosa]|uniref:HMA domain-containing protein n=1 Tax=Populus tomentosa TaxID=118781 RepID=A0A8X8A7U8_POPTO|nr:hypothetical protein POTOM_011408 [Populus tomentosa]
MESAVAISATTVPLFILSKALNRHSTTNTTRSLLRISSTQLVTRRLSSIYSRNNDLLPSSHSLKGLRAGVPLVRLRLECVSSSAASFGTTSGGGGGEFGGGGGGGGSNGGDAESNSVAEAVGAEEAPELSPDVIILDVGGMTCGGCAASVKRILESQSQVFSASVNLATETAIVRPVTEAKVVPNWQKQLGEALAKHLTSCGFISNLRERKALVLESHLFGGFAIAQSEFVTALTNIRKLGYSFIKGRYAILVAEQKMVALRLNLLCIVVMKAACSNGRSVWQTAFPISSFGVDKGHFYLNGVSGLGCKVARCSLFFEAVVREKYEGRDNVFKVFEKKMDEKRDRLKESGHQLAVSWTLCAVCLLGHVSHIFATKASWIHVFHSVGFHLSLSLFTLLGPGRQLIHDGVKSLFKGAPNMNTLVGLGALSSFSVSSIAALVPKLVFDAFSKRILDMFKSRVARLYLAQDFVGEFASHARCGFWSGQWSILGSLLEGSLDSSLYGCLMKRIRRNFVWHKRRLNDDQMSWEQYYCGGSSGGTTVGSDDESDSTELVVGWKAFFEEPIMLIAFVLLGRNLEQRAKIKAASDMTGLLSVLPTKARLVVNGDATDLGSIVEVPCSSLSIGDQIVVLPGDRVPADGTVRAGRSTIDESSFTGEPLPVTKLPGSQVSAGSINLNGSLTIEVKRPGGETAMGDIVRLVEEAQSREAPVQRLADKVSGHFTYGVMAISAATFMFWSMFGTRILPAALNQGNPVSLALQLSCSVLVVACPCALGLATPTAVLVGTSLGATRGLLLRGGNVLEKFSMVNSVVFDKTGTLTIGRPVVTKVVSLGGMEITDSQLKPNAMWSEVEVLKLAAGVESNTIHPVGKAIVEAAQAASCTSVKVTDGTFMEEPGSGAVATIENKVVSVGTLDWIQRHGVCENPFQEVEDINNQSVVYVGVDNKLAGLIYFEDQIREDARQVVESLSCQGINVYMLSGDRKKNAEHVASLVGIPKEKVLSGVKPDEKKKFISELQKDQNIVAMVGDGINDAAALAESHVGVAMGEGVGAASEVSSIVLMGNRLSQLNSMQSNFCALPCLILIDRMNVSVLDALELSRLTMKTVKQNLWWAFAYNIVGIPIAAGMLLPITGTILTPSIAGALMGFSSIGVMMNSLLLRLKFSSKQKKVRGAFPDPKIYLDSVLLDQKEKIKPPWLDSRWR